VTEADSQRGGVETAAKVSDLLHSLKLMANFVGYYVLALTCAETGENLRFYYSKLS
jgi:hypothetical protein